MRSEHGSDELENPQDHSEEPRDWTYWAPAPPSRKEDINELPDCFYCSSMVCLFRKSAQQYKSKSESHSSVEHHVTDMQIPEMGGREVHKLETGSQGDRSKYDTQDQALEPGSSPDAMVTMVAVDEVYQ